MASKVEKCALPPCPLCGGRVVFDTDGAMVVCEKAVNDDGCSYYTNHDTHLALCAKARPEGKVLRERGGLLREMYQLLLDGKVRFVGNLTDHQGSIWTWPDRAKAAMPRVRALKGGGK